MPNSKALEKAEKIRDVANSISNELDADIIVYSGDLFSPNDRRFVYELRKRKKKRKNVLLCLTTPGGSADAAYRIAHTIQQVYCVQSADIKDRGEFSVYVHEYCKSAGTILALGADRLIMSQLAELGPIDVQLQKDDEVGDWTSGLNALEALATLQDQSASLFMKVFRDLRFGREAGFSTKSSIEVATNLTAKLFEQIYSQIDPMRLGEIQRFVRISLEYGDRLATKNVKEGTVNKLVAGYPSHSFIIDRSEAGELFRRVGTPSDELELLGVYGIEQGLQNGAFENSPSSARAYFGYLNDDTELEDAKVSADADAGSSGEQDKPRTARKKRPGGKVAPRGRRSTKALSNGRAASE